MPQAAWTLRTCPALSRAFVMPAKAGIQRPPRS